MRAICASYSPSISFCISVHDHLKIAVLCFGSLEALPDMIVASGLVARVASVATEIYRIDLAVYILRAMASQAQPIPSRRCPGIKEFPSRIDRSKISVRRWQRKWNVIKQIDVVRDLFSCGMKIVIVIVRLSVKLQVVIFM